MSRPSSADKNYLRAAAGMRLTCRVLELRLWPLSCSFPDQAVISCGPFVFADQPAEDFAASYPRRRQAGNRGHCDVVAVRGP
jgi:hypothetical protein